MDQVGKDLYKLICGLSPENFKRLQEDLISVGASSRQPIAASVNSSGSKITMSPVEPLTTWETEYGTYQYLGYFPEENPTYPHKFLIDARVFWIDDCANYVLGLNKKANSLRGN